jgi:chitodextrinase
MAGNLVPLLAALALISCPPACLSAQAQPFQAPSSSQAPSSQALVGTWSATVNWNLPSGLLITTTFMSNGNIQSTTQNHMGMSFTLMGAYQFNAAQSTLSYKWSDFLPKQTCVGGYCTPAQPPAPMGVAVTNTIRFLSANQFVATSSSASTTYIRTNATGTPIP